MCVCIEKKGREKGRERRKREKEERDLTDEKLCEA